MAYLMDEQSWRFYGSVGAKRIAALDLPSMDYDALTDGWDDLRLHGLGVRSGDQPLIAVDEFAMRDQFTAITH